MEKATQKWKECLALIKERLGNDTAFATWFEPAVAVSLRGSVLTLRLPGILFKEAYEGRFFNIYSEALKAVLGDDVQVIYQHPKPKGTKETPRESKQLEPPAQTLRPPAKTAPAPDRHPKASTKQPTRQPEMPRLNEALSFENYCVSTCNKLPWTIAESIARQPVNSSFNPFFLYGEVGVGKTHLMQAIGLKVRQAFPDKKVVFLPMKEFQLLYQNAYLNSQIPAFLQWFQNCDVLLFDDLQEIAGSEGTLNNALFPIFSHLQMHGKQLVFTCDRPPQDLKELEARLIDRFKWGIVEKLERPDTALRKKILTFKAHKNGLDLPEEVIDYIAATPLNSVREIEGIVLNMFTRAINLSVEIDLELARVVVENATRSEKRKALNFDMIVEGVADAFRLNADVIFSKSRVKDVAEARMVIMYLAQRLLGLATGAIGRKLGRQHSTVIHGLKTVAEKVESDREFAESISRIEKNL